MIRNLHKYAAEWLLLVQKGKGRTYKPGEIIYMQGKLDIGLVCIMRGKVKNSVYFPNGTEKVICIFEAPAITGETSVIDNRETLVTTQALTDVEVSAIPASQVHELMEQNSRIMMMLLEVYAEKIRCLELQAESVVLSTQQKTARMLINFHSYGVFSHGAENKALHVTHDQLAGFLGTTRPKITSTLSAFEAGGLIKRNRGSIEILDEAALKSLYE
ncbi:MAG: Crp/Fnr family transcriptional regulator [Oscillospiraceae bacterium]|nr:Crp/Fnr family transcriptional regulator [Oscillospiraceae bacterium]